MKTNIKDKIALVTGANRGIGKAIVEAFLAEGAAKVYLAVRKPESAQPLVEKYKEKVSVVQLDMSNPTSIQSLAGAAPDVQIVVNNAGILETADPLSEGAEASFERELQVNTFGLMRVAKALSPVIEKNGGGALVQLNSVASLKNFTAFTTYSASKAASYSITQGLKELLEPKGIQVLSVHPGPIKTDMAVDAGFEDMSDPVEMVSEGIVEALAAGEFHLFPDTMAKQVAQAYEPFKTGVIEAVMEG